MPAPIAMGLMGAGLVLGGIGRFQANMAQADAEEANASFYREQADFARLSGDRQRNIFDRESEILYGEQRSAFAKAGVDTTSSSFFLAKTIVSRQEESYAIKQEADFNVRLALLRADQAHGTAESLRSPMNNALQFGGSALTGVASII